MTGIQGQGTQSRGDVEVDLPFFEIYNKETSVERKLPNLEITSKDDFILKEELPYVISSLKEFLKNNRVIIEEVNEDEIIDEEDLAAMKATEIKDQNADKISVVFEYKYGIEGEEITETSEVDISLGRNSENNLVISLERVGGNQLYYKKIVRALRNKFSYCLA